MAGRKKQPKEIGNKFDFLGYGFRTRTIIDKFSRRPINSFAPAISDKSKKAIREKMRAWKIYNYTSYSAEEIANIFKSRIVGWINYYGKFRKSELYEVFDVLDNAIIKWVKKKYKIVSTWKAVEKFKELKNAKVFAHFVLLSRMDEALGRAV
jgi:RNA-directed DNA polymerase